MTMQTVIESLENTLKFCEHDISDTEASLAHARERVAKLYAHRADLQNRRLDTLQAIALLRVVHGVKPNPEECDTKAAPGIGSILDPYHNLRHDGGASLRDKAGHAVDQCETLGCGQYSADAPTRGR